MNKKNITPTNDKGQRHGYQECYWSAEKLLYKGNFVNGERQGYAEWYGSNGKLNVKTFHLI